jgi:hypothetical protein
MATNWAQTFENCSNYRVFLGDQDMPTGDKSIGFLFTKEDIDELLKQGEGLDGIRIYVGLEVYATGGNAVRLYAVGTQKAEGDNYDDYAIPTVNEVSTTLLHVGRPCPYYCGSANGLNS